jgi:hypothetical protein
MTGADRVPPRSSVEAQVWEAFRQDTVAINRAAHQGDWALMQTLVAARNGRQRALLSVPAPVDALIHHQQILTLDRESMELVAVARNRVGDELFKLHTSRKAASAYGDHLGPA